MGMSAGGKTRSAISEINVTPMADVMIVLLIIFMVMTPLIREPVQLPDAAQAKEKKGERIDVVVGTNGQITAGQETFATAAALGDHLALRFAGSPVPPVSIQADRSATYSEVEGVLEACRKAGSVEIALGARLPVSRP
jgi:biopolymer transport protein ExbD